MLSDYYKKIANEYGIKIGNVKKLILHLGDKTNYALHYINLHFYLSLRMKLTKSHKVLKFKKSNGMRWMNTENKSATWSDTLAPEV